MIPNCKNFCGGNFKDWLEVNLIKECNGKCSWCIEKDGWHPEEVAEWWKICAVALKTGKQNIILLGGEPTLHKNVREIVQMLSTAGRDVWITTNGSRLTEFFVSDNLVGIKGINISIHHYDLNVNKEITGIALYWEELEGAITELHRHKAFVRFNCNCVSGYIDSADEIRKYVAIAKETKADKIRFAELKHDDGGFVDLAKILNYKYGLNDNPFVDGCQSDTVIDGMPVNFRQMCGLQTSRRMKPEDPQQAMKEVLYYDGKIYKGWQTNKNENKNGGGKVRDRDLVKLLEQVADGKVSPAEAAFKIGKDLGKAQGRLDTLTDVGDYEKRKSKSLYDVADEINEEMGLGGGCYY